MDGMNHFSYGTPEPTVKFEPSPAESVMSTPSGEYPSLFANSPMPSTMNPRDIMTPESTHDDDFHNDNASQSANDRSGVSQTPEPGQGEKKQTKKRKSWGQVLPEPKTNLPPRKRAKTEDEKEQRRVERVLRNRRAAQSSRERKRQEVEALEKTNQELRDQLAQANRIIQQLVQKVGETPSSTTLDALRPNPLTFSQELFNSQDGHMAPQPSSTASSLMDGILMNSQSSNTVNPASLSPSLLPVPEQDEDDWLAQNESSNTAPLAPVVPRTAQAATEETSPDATQLPAAKLCSSDLQCRSAEAPPQSQPTATSTTTTAQQHQLFLFLMLFLTPLFSTISASRQPLLQVAMSMRAGFSLRPTPAILNTIIWLVTTRRRPSSREATASTTTSTSPSSSRTTSLPSRTKPSSPTTVSTAAVPVSPAATSSRSPALRLRTLRRILSCSPHLARPLRDATLEVLRLAVSKKSNELSTVDEADWRSSTDDKAGDGSSLRQQLDQGSEYLKYVPQGHEGRLPAWETLMALAWFCESWMKMSSGEQQMESKTPSMDVETLNSAPRWRSVHDSERLKPTVDGGMDLEKSVSFL